MKPVSLFLALLLTCATSDASSLGRWNVATDGSTTTTGITGLVGQNYSIRVTGTFRIGGPGDGLADAEYADFSNTPSSLIDIIYTGDDLGLVVNGSKPRLGVYSATHTYTHSFSGTGAVITFGYLDNLYTDNIGYLEVELFDSPTPDPIPPTVTIRPAVQIAWSSVEGQTYIVQVSTSMNGGSWETVHGPVAGTGVEMTYCERTDTSPRRFYRVTTQ